LPTLSLQLRKKCIPVSSVKRFSRHQNMIRTYFNAKNLAKSVKHYEFSKLKNEHFWSSK
jgi:hypothetical protein